MRFRRAVLMFFAGWAAAGAAAADPPGYKDWEKSPEAYFMTRAERKDWARLRTDEEARAFIERYWSRRDPAPATPGNEFREMVRRRIGAAEEQFTMTRQKGARSTRGKLLVVLGPPTHFTQERQEQRPDPTANITNPRDLARIPGRDRVLVQTWVYKKEKFGQPWELGDVEIRIQVDQDRGLDEPLSSSFVGDVVERVAQRSIVNPDALTPADFAAGGAAAPAAVPISGTGGLPAAARTVLESFLKEKRVSPGSFWAAPFRTGAGERSYFLQFALPAEIAPERARFGGSVRSLKGGEIIGFWEEGPLSDPAGGTGKSRVFERAIALPAGEYVGEFGLFSADGNLLAAAKESFTIEPATGAFGVSPLILATDVVRIETAASGPAGPPPFLFGSEKPFRARPEGDRLFPKTGSLWYFLTVENPAVSAAAPSDRPRVMLKISVLRDGKPAFEPFANVADLAPLGSGLYAAGSEIPLSRFSPGRYTFSVRARDLNAPRDSPAWKGIERQAPFVVPPPEGALPLERNERP